VSRDFTNWIKGRILAYGFVKGQDYDAFLKTEERVDKGIADIENVLDALGKPHSRFGACYLDPNGRERKMYNLDEDTAMNLAMGYSIVLQGKVWKLCRELHQEVKVLTPEEQMATGLIAAQQLIAQKDEIITKRTQELQDKTLFVEQITARVQDLKVAEAAKVLDVGVNWLFAYLRKHGFMYKASCQPNARWCI